MLTTHPLLVSRLRKSWSIPPLTLWAHLGLLRCSPYRHLSPDGNPIAVNKYHLSSSIFYLHATFSASLILPEFIGLKAYDECTWHSHPIRSFLQDPVANIIFLSNIFLSTLFWKVLRHFVSEICHPKFKETLTSNFTENPQAYERRKLQFLTPSVFPLAL